MLRKIPREYRWAVIVIAIGFSSLILIDLYSLGRLFVWSYGDLTTEVRSGEFGFRRLPKSGAIIYIDAPERVEYSCELPGWSKYYGCFNPEMKYVGKKVLVESINMPGGFLFGDVKRPIKVQIDSGEVVYHTDKSLLRQAPIKAIITHLGMACLVLIGGFFIILWALDYALRLKGKNAGGQQ